MDLIGKIWRRTDDHDRPFLISRSEKLSIRNVVDRKRDHLEEIRPGEVVALIGDFNAQSISDLLVLIGRKTIVLPLSVETRNDHEYFFESALVDWIVEGGTSLRRRHSEVNPLLEELRGRSNPGLILFSTGTTGRPKAILHDLSTFLKRFETPRPTLRTMAFLLFDHIGGINTLLHTMFNGGVVITPTTRSVDGVLRTCREFDVEVLPTTPTFLRMILLSGLVPDGIPECIKIITYGTERMDQLTLDELCKHLPQVDFRQTFGMSELGILRVKSRSRDSLYMRVGGDGVQTAVESGVLKILSPTRMMGYLNAESPFDDRGWYNTGDMVEIEGDYLKVIGRVSDVVNVGGLKFLASEVERVALEHPLAALVAVKSCPNPVTGQHIELTFQPRPDSNIDPGELREFFSLRLPPHMIPRRIRIGAVSVGHRFKRIN